MLSVCTECCRYAPALATTCAHAASGPVQCAGQHGTGLHQKVCWKVYNFLCHSKSNKYGLLMQLNSYVASRACAVGRVQTKNWVGFSFSGVPKMVLPVPESKIRKHFSIQIPPQNLGKMTSGRHFGHSKVVFRPFYTFYAFSQILHYQRWKWLIFKWNSTQLNEMVGRI